jgi:predicted phage terminase large subunit-like protein
MTDANVSQKIIVMQRLATNDLSGHCLTKKEGMYRHICLPAEAGPNVSPPELAKHYTEGLLDVVRLPLAVLRQFRISLGSNNYSGQYMQNPIADEGNLVKPEWFGRFKLEEIERQAYEDNEQIAWDIFLDGAYTEKEVNCPSGLLCAAQWRNNLYIRDVARVWMELPELIKYVPDMSKRHGLNGISRVIIEPKASGLPAAQMLRRYTSLNVVIDKAPTADKVVRLKGCLPFIEAHRVYLLENAPWLDMFLDELKAFPFGEFDDITDCVSMAVSRANLEVESGSIIGFGVV